MNEIAIPMAARLRSFRQDRRGVTAMEFGLVLPLLLFAGLGGLEVANMAVAHMRINQIAVSLADNASRVKQQTTSGAPKFREADANEVFRGAERQGRDLDLMAHGRVFLSSLELNEDGGQWIHWQRCAGEKTDYTSSYGEEDEGSTGMDFAGMGPEGKRVTTEDKNAIMFAEVVYEYQPLIVDLLFDSLTIRKYSAMYVRDDRDLTGAGIHNPAPEVVASTC